MPAGLNINVAVAAVVVTFCASYEFGYNIGVLNQPNKLVTEFFQEVYGARWHRSVSESEIKWLVGLNNALFAVGLIVGSLIGGALADRLGRIGSNIFSQTFTCIGIVLATCCHVANSPEMLIIGRIFFGIHSGIANIVAPMFLAEVVPSNLRGAFGVMHQLMCTVGILLAAVFGLPQLLTQPDRWPFLFVLQLGPVLVAFCALWAFPDTPRYLLLMRNDEPKTRKSLKFYRRTDDIDAEVSELNAVRQQLNEQAGETKFTTCDLFTKKYRRQMFTAVFLQVCQQLSGINAVMFYSSSIYRGANVPESGIPYATIITSAVNCGMSFVALPLMDVAGRRVLLILPMITMILALVLLVIMISLKQVWASYVGIVGVIVYVIAFAIGLGPIPWMIASEIFQQRERSAANAACGFVNYLGTLLVALAFEPIQAAIDQYVFVIFIGLLVVFVIFVIMFVPETRNRTFEEIARDLNVSHG